MSSSSLTDSEALRGVIDRTHVPRSVVAPITRIAFWLAIVLPFLHLPLLATGLETTAMATAFIIMVALNICALVVGHRYGA